MLHALLHCYFVLCWVGGTTNELVVPVLRLNLISLEMLCFNVLVWMGDLRLMQSRMTLPLLAVLLSHLDPRILSIIDQLTR